MITQAELKKMLHYDPETGVFTWLVQRQRMPAGSIAGWKNQGYIRIKIFNKAYAAHRLAWLYVYGCLPSKDIDHINHIRSDNRISNLREAGKENHKNKLLYKNNSTGLIGVHWIESRQKWQARIGKNSQHVGISDSLFEAACMRKAAEINLGYHKNHGNLANRYEDE